MLNYLLVFVIGLLLGAAIVYITELKQLDILDSELEADRKLLREIHRKLYSHPDKPKEK